MKTKEKILGLLRIDHGRTATEMAEVVGISKQAVSSHLRDLMTSGRVIKEGATRGAAFRLARPGEGPLRVKSLARKRRLAGLEEDRVFKDIAAHLALRKHLSPEAFKAVGYGFTEMLNNAIDHSRSDDCRFTCALDTHDLSFTVRDFGIGVFESIRSQFALSNEDAAVTELLKGKVTTMAARHSGEGIFFTSKLADRFALRSHRTRITFKAARDDMRVEEIRFQKGTEVQFVLSSRSRRDLNAVFLEYAPEEFDYEFARTRVLVHVALHECVSRSEAKRMVARLEGFREVILDFRSVAEMGQAFADEAFRVFVKSNPGVLLRLQNLSPRLRPMVSHVMDDSVAGQVVFED